MRAAFAVLVCVVLLPAGRLAADDSAPASIAKYLARCEEARAAEVARLEAAIAETEKRRDKDRAKELRRLKDELRVAQDPATRFPAPFDLEKFKSLEPGDVGDLPEQSATVNQVFGPKTVRVAMTVRRPDGSKPATISCKFVVDGVTHNNVGVNDFVKIGGAYECVGRDERFGSPILRPIDAKRIEAFAERANRR